MAKRKPTTKGFVCVVCGRPLHVFETRARATNIVTRSRGCPVHGGRVITEERPRTRYR